MLVERQRSGVTKSVGGRDEREISGAPAFAGAWACGRAGWLRAGGGDFFFSFLFLAF